MLKLLIGVAPDPVVGAIAIAVGFIMLGIFATTWLARRRSRQDISNDFELAKLKVSAEAEASARIASNAHKERMADIASKEAVERERIGQNLITSHSRDSEHG